MSNNLFRNNNDLFQDSVKQVSSNFDLKRLETDVDHVEKTYIKKIISADQYNALMISLYANTVSAQQLALLQYCRNAIGYLALLNFLPSHNVTIGNNGLFVPKSENTLPASEYRTEELKKSMLKKGYASLDTLADHIESNTAFFPEYLNSPERTQRLNGIVITPSQFQQAYGRKVPQFLFLMVQKFVRDAELDYIVPSIGQETYDLLIAQAQDQAIGQAVLPDYAKPLRAAQYAACHRAMLNAIPQLNLSFSEDGLVQIDSTRNRNVPKGQVAATDLARQQLVEHAERQSRSYLSALVDHLNAHASASLFTEYFESDLYEDPDAEPESYRDNLTGGFAAL